MDADETWGKYKLFKIKFESDNINELKEYGYITAAEEEDEIDNCFTSSKELPDFLLPPPVLQSIPTKSLKRSFDFNLSPGSIILKQSNICSALSDSLPLHTEEQSTSYSESLSLPNYFLPSKSTEKEQSNFFTGETLILKSSKKKKTKEVQKKNYD
ncbi:uncharacterized protein LOC105844087 isoform X2 [Hydra vulgaris]|uniref:uncharacterized protein LOC105844087 isoform X2 n=1 Tax=Hydra vulgaris TaxID=6087 RepID=UPI0032EA41BE